MNGSGTTDIVWIDVSGSADKAWQYLELFPSGRAGLLKTIDNGLGKVTRISYAAAARGAAHARDNGTPWTTRMNIGMPVVERGAARKRTWVIQRLSRITLTTTALGTRTSAHLPALAREFKPKTATAQRQHSSRTRRSTRVSRTRVMRGQPLTSEQRDTIGNYLSVAPRTATPSRDLETALDGRNVHYAFKSSEQVEHIEGKDTSAERVTLTEWEQDPYGNITKESKWGEVVSR